MKENCDRIKCSLGTSGFFGVAASIIRLIVDLSIINLLIYVERDFTMIITEKRDANRVQITIFLHF